jgi:hypothetical protein
MQTQKAYITEDYVVVLSHQGVPKDAKKLGKLRTLFADLSHSQVRVSHSVCVYVCVCVSGRVLMCMSVEKAPSVATKTSPCVYLSVYLCSWESECIWCAALCAWGK